MVRAVANIVAVACDRAVVDDGHDLVGVEAVNIDAGAVVPLDRRPGVIGDAHREAYRGVDGAAGDAMAPAFDQAAGVVGDLHAAIILCVDAVATAACGCCGFDRTGVEDNAVDARPHCVCLASLHEGAGEIVHRVGAREDGVKIDDLRAARRGVQRRHHAIIV